MEPKALTPWFVTGLIEGEGCFSGSFSFREKLKLGIETRPSFSVSLNKRDIELIKNIHNFLVVAQFDTQKMIALISLK